MRFLINIIVNHIVININLFFEYILSLAPFYNPRAIFLMMIVVFNFNNTILKSDEDLVLNRDFSQENIEEPLKQDLKGGPFRFEFSSNAIGMARLQKDHLQRNFLQYTEFENNLIGVFYYNKEPKEAAFLSIGYEYVNLNVKYSFFKQKDFNNLSLALGGATKRFNNYLFRFQILSTINIDHMNFNKYLCWDMLLWGRYNYCENMHFHFGVIGLMGMKINSVVPLIGVDYRINAKWKINAVFPVNLSLVYGFNEYWSVAIAARAVTSRNRLGKSEFLSEGLYEYRSGGMELNLRYQNENCSNIEVHLHLGCGMFGRLRLTNSNHHHARDYRLGTAPYVGGEITFRP